MNKFFLSSALIAMALLAAGREQGLQRRIRELEVTPVARPEEVAQLEQQLEQQLSLLEGRLERVHRALNEDRTAERVEAIESRLGETGAALARHGRRLQGWESVWQGHEPELFEQRLREMRSVLEERWTEVDEVAASAAEIAQQDRARIEQLDDSLGMLQTGRDIERMWHELVGPVVQIAGDATVGSGVLLESRRVEEDAWLTYLLTSWHVVRDIYGTTDRVDMPVDVKVYLENGTTRVETARMLIYDVDLDAALLRLETAQPVEFGARLAPRSRVEGVQVFDSVYAVGCPLGNDPIPTAGEVAATRHLVDGETYWMISAPTYIGNSGGGIFDAESHELLGIFSKIYTHGTMRSTIVPHMGLVTPLAKIYDWLDTAGYAHVAQYDTAETAMATAHR
jgi:S1-C subfamily serine protease